MSSGDNGGGGARSSDGRGDSGCAEGGGFDDGVRDGRCDCGSGGDDGVEDVVEPLAEGVLTDSYGNRERLEGAGVEFQSKRVGTG